MGCPNFSILNIVYCLKLNNFINLIFVETGIFGKFLEFSKLKIFRILQSAIFFYFPNYKFY